MEDKDKLISVITKIANIEDKSPEIVVAELNNMSESQINNKLKMVGILKKGGKLDYLLCLQKGGSIKDCGCGGKVKKGQFGLSDLNDAQVNERTIKQGDTIVRAYLPDLSGAQTHQHLEIRGNDDGRMLRARTEITSQHDTQNTGVFKTNPSRWDLLLGRKQMPAEWKPILDRLLNTQPVKK